MNKEELKIHCEKQIEMCKKLNDYKHLEEHQLILDIIKENEKLHHYKTLYQSLKKQKEELRSWLEEGKRVSIAHENMISVNFISLVLSKLEELEQPKKQLLKPSHYDEDIDVEYELEKARKFIQEDKKRKFGKE